MTFLVDKFRNYFLAQGLRENSFNNYRFYLKKVDEALGKAGLQGIDEAISNDLPGLQRWAKTTASPPFDDKPANPRSALKKYLQFRESEGDIVAGEEDTEFEDQIPLEPTGQAFHLERDMQAAVRRQITALEPGLRIVDGGNERRVATGEIDIVAKDAQDNFVVIELKAGECPKGAIEQLLGYSNDLRIEEEVKEVRMFLIAQSFSDRIVGAATLVPGLRLVTYDYTLSFRVLE